MRKIIFAGIVIALGVVNVQARIRTVEVSTNSVLYKPGTLCIRQIDTYDGRTILSETPISADAYITELHAASKDLEAKKAAVDAQTVAVEQIKTAAVKVEPDPIVEPTPETPVEAQP